MKFECAAELWEYPGNAAWHFVTLPKTYSEDIALVTREHKRGFGSVRVRARIGESTWDTSIFPDSKSGCYLLPIKKAIRQQEHLASGSRVNATIEVLKI